MSKKSKCGWQEKYELIVAAIEVSASALCGECSSCESRTILSDFDEEKALKRANAARDKALEPGT